MTRLSSNSSLVANEGLSIEIGIQVAQPTQLLQNLERMRNCADNSFLSMSEYKMAECSSEEMVDAAGDTTTQANARCPPVFEHFQMTLNRRPLSF